MMNRTRRRIAPAVDHDPLVEIEPAFGAQPPPLKRPGRPLVARSIRFSLGVGGFVVTFILIALGYFAFASALTRTPPDWSLAAAPAPERGPPWASMVRALFDPNLLATEEVDHDFLFLPNRGRERALEFQSGAADAAAELLDVAAIGPDAEAIAAAWRAAGEGREPRRLALAAARNEVARFTGPEALDLPPVARAAGAALAKRAQALRAIAGHSGVFPVGWRHEAAFFRARGEAYGWRLLLGRIERADSNAALRDALAALESAANYQPTILFSNAGARAPAPDHFTLLADRLDAAAAACAEVDPPSQP
jgi:hypothetical protein